MLLTSPGLAAITITQIHKTEATIVEAQTLTFTLEKETKNTIRYQEDVNGKPPAIGTIYVQKWLMGEAPPRNLTVTITES